MIYDYFINLNPVLQALIATSFTWLMTAIGAAMVFIKWGVNKKVLDTMLGFAAGVMIAASFWSLLAPSIEMSRSLSLPSWFPAASGFLIGAIFLRIVDAFLPHLHLWLPKTKAEGIPTKLHRSVLLVLAITLHNFPEGLAIGVAFGAAASGYASATVAGAIALAIGIGIQNLPEGLAVSMPLHREGISKSRSFWYGQLSAVVEPIAGVMGALVVIIARPILPYALGFAAGAMVFVVVEELIPTSQDGGNSDKATIGLVVGFTVMMVLDVAFG